MSEYIIAKCADCDAFYELDQALQCPVCSGNHVSYAWKSSQPPQFWAEDRRRVDNIHAVTFCMACYRQNCVGQCMANVAAEVTRCDSFSDTLAPYSHALNSRGTDCEVDCPACLWARDRLAQQPAIDELDRLFALQDPRDID